MKIIEKICNIILCFGALCILLFPSCTKTEHVEGVPYAAKIDSIVPHAGNSKVDFDVYISSFQIETVRIYWNNRQDLKELNIGGQTGVYRITIENLDAMPYEFTIYSYDKFRRESLPTKTSVIVYDDEYLASLWNRGVIKAVHRFGTVNISWSEPVPNEVKTEVIYTNKQGEETIREVFPMEYLTEMNDFRDWTLGFEFKTYILPEPTALDLFVTPVKRQELINDNVRQGKIWDACESLSGWSGMGLSLDGNDPQEGYYCIQASGHGVVIYQKNSAIFDTEVSKENGYLAFSMYVDDVTSFGAVPNGQFEITASGGPDQQETHWSIQQMNLVNGWNEVELKLSEAEEANADIHALNYLRFYCVTMTKGMTIKIDRIRFYEISNE
ncbi:MAG: DUF4998 domain-containing protein [Tannerella sp.]|jgi:hypothetical protein|nr:DUF4998 domain-containing protein [Tannerella sp.]